MFVQQEGFEADIWEDQPTRVVAGVSGFLASHFLKGCPGSQRQLRNCNGDGVRSDTDMFSFCSHGSEAVMLGKLFDFSKPSGKSGVGLWPFFSWQDN